MKLGRRGFLRWAMAAGGACVTRGMGAGGGLDRSMIGANTAILGAGLFEAIGLLRELGFGTIEIHPFGEPQPRPGEFPGFEWGKFSGEERERLLEALKGFRHVAAHLPYKGLSYFARDRGESAEAHRQMGEALAAAAGCGAEVGVAHVTAPKGISLKEAWPEIVAQFRAWGDVAKGLGFRIAVETGYPASTAEFVRLVQAIDHESVGCAIDVGHQIWCEEFKARVPQAERSTPGGIGAYNDVMHEIIDALGAKVIHFHVHDIDPATWKEHKPIGLGVIDYPRLFKKLVAMDYRGLLVLEIGAEDMRVSLGDNKRRLEAFLGGRV